MIASAASACEGVDIETSDPKFLFAIKKGQWETDVTQSHNAHARLALFDFLLQLVQG